MFEAGSQDIFVGTILVISFSGSMIKQERNVQVEWARMLIISVYTVCAQWSRLNITLGLKCLIVLILRQIKLNRLTV